MGYMKIISEDGVQDVEDMSMEEMLGVWAALMAENVSGIEQNKTKKGKLMKTETEELVECPICKKEGIVAPDIWGKETFFHKVPSPRIDGYYSFTNIHDHK